MRKVLELQQLCVKSEATTVAPNSLVSTFSYFGCLGLISSTLSYFVC